MNLPKLNKIALNKDTFSFPDEEAKMNRFLLNGEPVNFDALKPITELPHQWLSSEDHRTKRFRFVPDMLDEVPFDKYVWLTVDEFPTKIVKNKGELLQYDTIFETVNADFGNKVSQPAKYALNHDTLELEVERYFGEPLPITPRVGDALRFGTRIRYNPANFSLDCANLANRLICTNGMSKVLAKHSYRGEGGSADAQLEFLKESTKLASFSSAEFAMKAMMLSRIAVPKDQNPTEFLSMLCKQYGFNDAQTQAVISRFDADGDVDKNAPNLWDITNAVTNATSHDLAFRTNRSYWSDASGMILSEASDKGITLVNSLVPKLIAEIWGR